jgi:tetratricopeptide (TPR) repeat protein
LSGWAYGVLATLFPSKAGLAGKAMLTAAITGFDPKNRQSSPDSFGLGIKGPEGSFASFTRFSGPVARVAPLATAASVSRLGANETIVRMNPVMPLLPIGRWATRLRIMNAKTRKQQIEEMLAEDPNDPFLRYGLAMEYVSAGDDTAAVKCLQDLIGVASDYVPAYQQLGQILVRLGRSAEARQAWTQGVQIAQKVGNEHARDEMQEFIESLS